MNKKICSFSGHRPEKLPFLSDEASYLYQTLYKMLNDKIIAAIAEGYTHFITGMALGVDLICAEIVISLKKTTHPNLILEAAIPFPNQAQYWSEDEQRKYAQILHEADIKTYIKDKFTVGVMMLRNKYMVDHSSRLIAVCAQSSGGTWKTINMALEKGIYIDLINPFNNYAFDKSSATL